MLKLYSQPLHQRATNYGPVAKSSLLWLRNFSWNKPYPLVCLLSKGCHPATKAELRSCSRDHMASEPEIFTIWSFRKRVLTLFPHHLLTNKEESRWLLREGPQKPFIETGQNPGSEITVSITNSRQCGMVEGAWGFEARPSLTINSTS